MVKQYFLVLHREGARFKRRLLLTGKPLLVVAAAVFFTSLPLVSPDNNELIENRVGRPILFKLRELAGLAPRLDPRVKVFAFDDASLFELGKPESLTPEIWKEILAAFSANHPKAILIDMIFATKRRTPAELQKYLDLFAGLPALATGAFLSPVVISKRPLLDLDQPEFKVGDSGLSFVHRYESRFRHLLPYGPAEELVPALKKLGSITFRSPGWIAPVSVFPTDRSLKHLSLHAADQISYAGDELLVNGISVPLSRGGEVPINWSSPQEYFQNTAQLLAVLKDWRNGRPPAIINPGDIVIFLPLMYTGNSDFKSTMVGELPGGYHVVGMVNSVLTGNWLRTVDFGFFAIAAALGLGLLSCGFRRVSTGIAYCLVVDVAIIGIPFLLFVQFGTLVNWVVPLLDFNVTAVSLLCLGAVTREVRSLRLTDALKGVISPGLLKKIVADPSSYSLESNEKTLTIMFIDLVGFSTSAERLSPQLLFGHLKETLSLLTDIVHRHGGIVDKSLGDGILGFFGYNPLSSEVSPDHADQAMACAAEVQRTLSVRCCEQHKLGLPVFPARIGLNTGPVYIGNLGEGGRIDLTVVGLAVNLSKRFEDAAEPFKVLLGPATRMYLTNTHMRKSVTLRRTSIKHQKTLIDAYEYDPLEDQPDLFSAAQKAYREYAGIMRTRERFLVEGAYDWQIWVGGRLVGLAMDYSKSGFELILDGFYANKVKLEFDLTIKRRVSSAEAEPEQRIPGLVGMICWGRKIDSRFRHGLELTDESSRRADLERFAPLAMDSMENSA